MEIPWQMILLKIESRTINFINSKAKILDSELHWLNLREVAAPELSQKASMSRFSDFFSLKEKVRLAARCTRPKLRNLRSYKNPYQTRGNIRRIHEDGSQIKLGKFSSFKFCYSARSRYIDLNRISWTYMIRSCVIFTHDPRRTTHPPTRFSLTPVHKLM